MKVVFLDFDGPIIPEQSHLERRPLKQKAWPPAITALNRITRTTGAKIVVSSTWRLAGFEDVRRHLRNWGASGDVIGITPCGMEEEGKEAWSATRGQEIAAWLAEHPEVESFVILDDDRDMEHLMPFLVHTPFVVGLTESTADRAIEVLKQGNTRDR
jgi:hypothetical protein